VYACGLNNMGQLGIGSLEPNYTKEPMLVEALEGKGVVQLSGGEHHSLALDAEGQVYAFGRGDSSQLGLGDGADQHLSPQKVEGLADVRIRKVTSGSNQNFAVAKSGDLYSWGFGEMGQLCNAREADEHTPFLVEPTQMSGLATLDAASGGQHSVLLCMQAEQ
jgi:regulator of chromosome condensation